MPNDSRITIATVAKAAQVSKMTVSRVLNGQPGVSNKTRLRIQETMRALGYVANPAARTLRGASKILGLVAPGITSAYMGQVITGISRAADRLDYGLMLYTQGTTSQHTTRTTYYASLLSNGLVDGVVLIVPQDYEMLVRAFKEHRLPYILVDHHSNTDEEPAVTATNRKGIVDAMRHLMALGHKRIGFIMGRANVGSAKDRFQGYRDALAEIGLPYDSELVREGDFEQSSGFFQGGHLLHVSPRPTAIVASNDTMAFGVMDAIKEAGLRVGRDISVVGFDDIPMAAQVYPPLTTVRQPLAEMGETAIDMLVTLLQRGTLSTLHRELVTELIVRESTARVPQE